MRKRREVGSFDFEWKQLSGWMDFVRYQTSWSFESSFQKSDGQVDLVGRDAFNVQPVHVLFTNEQFRNFIGTMVVQGDPGHGIDMVGKKGAILLGQTCKRSSFGKDVSDVLVVLFDGAFLPRAVGVAEEHVRKNPGGIPERHLDGLRA